MNEKKFAFISCVNDEVLYKECVKHIDSLVVPEGYTVEKVKIAGAKGLAEAYNKAMEDSDAKYKIYLHQDTFVLNKNFLEDIVRLFTKYPKLGMLGVIGSTRLPESGIWFQDGLHCFGEVWEYRKAGGIHYLLGWWNQWNHRKKRLTRYRRVRRDYLPVAGIDGLIMITQYDIPWRKDLYSGFIYYEGPHVLEFIKQGFEVGIPYQQQTWCMHYGNQRERTPEEDKRYQEEFHANMKIFRKEYGSFLKKTARELNAQFAG